jgi:hypothetical protein
MEVFNRLIHLYDQFLHLFPDPWHPWVSIVIFVLMVLLILRHLKGGVIGVILLALFVPASIPILRNIGMAIIQFADHVLGSK